MRIFPFASATEAWPKPDFMMEFPCIVGHRGRYKNDHIRFSFLSVKVRGFLFMFDRKDATPIADKAQLDKLLQCISMLGDTEGVFVEPMEVAK